MQNLDQKDCLILNLLQENCRASLTEIAEKVGLSIDSIKKRIDHLAEDGIFFPKIQLRPRHFGFENIIDIRIKLHNYTEKELSDFIKYLKQHPRVSEVFSLSGEWNFAIVILSKDFSDLGKVTGEIRTKFAKIISEWSESLTTAVHKFEIYDMLKLKEYEAQGGHEKWQKN